MWLADLGSLRQRLGSPDVVLAADVLYDPEIVPGFVRALVELLRPSDPSGTGTIEAPIALVAATLRNPMTMELFVSEISKAPLNMTMVPFGGGLQEGWDDAPFEPFVYERAQSTINLFSLSYSKQPGC